MPRIAFRSHALLPWGIALILAPFATGADTYSVRTAALTQALRAGNVEATLSSSANLLAGATKDPAAVDLVVCNLEHGAALRIAALAEPVPVEEKPVAGPAMLGEGPLEMPAFGPSPLSPRGRELALQCINIFDTAEAGINNYETKARISVGNELMGVLFNQASLPYRGTGYDKIMLNTYKALIYLRLGRIDDARVELNRVGQRQADVKADNERRIKAAREEAKKARSGIKDSSGNLATFDVEAARGDPKTQAALAEAFADLDAVLNARSYQNYVNPFATLLDGIFFTHVGDGGSDWERGRKSWQQIVQINPENRYAVADLSLAESAANYQPSDEPVTYVIFETGSAPRREQRMVKVPIPFSKNDIVMADAPLPQLKFDPDYLPSLTVGAGDRAHPTLLVASMDTVIAQDFKNGIDAVVIKTLISTALKTVADRYINKEIQKGMDNGSKKIWGGNAFLEGLATLGKDEVVKAKDQALASINIADERSWQMLPKEIQYARLETPADRQLKLTAESQTCTVSLVPGTVNVVVVLSRNKASPLIVSQFALK